MTAINRTSPSAPARLISDGYIFKTQSILDWGCGYGKDVEFFRSKTKTVFGYDPAFSKELPSEPVDLITCIYVLCTLPNTKQRVQCIRDASNCLKLGGKIIIAARSKYDLKKDTATSYGLTHDEIRRLIVLAGLKPGFIEEELFKNKRIAWGVGLLKEI